MNDKTHIYITMTAMERTGIKFTEEEKEILRKMCTKPDYDEREYFYTYHFYNPTRKYGKGEITALTKCLIHYEKAKAKGNLEELGRSIHFLEDLCTPVHCGYSDKFDYVYRIHQHMEFEKMCDNLVTEINISDIDYKFIPFKELEVLCINCACQSYVYFKELDKKSTNQKMIGERSILCGIQAVSEILKKFQGEKVNQISK